MTDTGRMQRECDLVTYYDEVLRCSTSPSPTMSTLLHVADADLDAALAEIVRVLRPAAPFAVGLWGGRDLDEGRHGEPTHGPARFFSFRSDEKVCAALGRHGTVERWETWESTSDLHYQLAVVRTPA